VNQYEIVITARASRAVIFWSKRIAAGL